MLSPTNRLRLRNQAIRWSKKGTKTFGKSPQKKTQPNQGKGGAAKGSQGYVRQRARRRPWCRSGGRGERGGAVQKPRETLTRRSRPAGVGWYGKCEGRGGAARDRGGKKKNGKGSEGNEWRESERVIYNRAARGLVPFGIFLFDDEVVGLGRWAFAGGGK